MGDRNASSMWKMTAKVISAFVPPPLPMDFQWTLEHWVEAAYTGRASVKLTVLKLTQNNSIHVLTMKTRYFYGVFLGTKENAVSYISSQVYVRIICTEEQWRLIFAGLRAADQPLPCTALFSALRKIARSHTLTAERSNEAFPVGRL